MAALSDMCCVSCLTGWVFVAAGRATEADAERKSKEEEGTAPPPAFQVGSEPRGWVCLVVWFVWAGRLWPRRCSLSSLSLPLSTQQASTVSVLPTGIACSAGGFMDQTMTDIIVTLSRMRFTTMSVVPATSQLTRLCCGAMSGEGGAQENALRYNRKYAGRPRPDAQAKAKEQG